MLKKFVLWGHRLNDYKAMFNLSESFLETSEIIEYGSGITSFNAEMTALGRKVISIDPMYALTLEEIKASVNEVFDATIETIKNNKEKYNWKNHDALKALIHSRREGIELFYNDFDQGIKEGRYLSCINPDILIAEDCCFDLALITHHLFVNFDDQGVEEHVALIHEMIKIAGEVHVFPLLDKYGQISKLLGPVMLSLQQSQLGLEVCQVGSQLQKSGNAMLRVWAVECALHNAKDSKDVFMA